MFLRTRHVFLDDAGTTTEEAILMIVFSSFAITLFLVLKSESVRRVLTDLVMSAISAPG